jgi:pilus assembly protein CpaE
MASLVRIVIVDSDPDSRAALRRILGATPSVALMGDFSDIPEAIRDCQGRHPDIFIAEVPHAQGSTDGWSVAPVEQLARGFPDSAVLATGPSVSVDLVIQVMRAGAVEFLPRPVERADLMAALEKMARMRRSPAPTRRAGRITSVFSTKGGLGVTTLAINLALCLAEQKPGSTLLAELDTRQSDIATFLDLRATYSVMDAFENLHRMDESFLQGLLVKHGKGLWVLPGPPRMERAQLNAEQVHGGLEMIRAHFEHIVLDLRHDMDPGTIAGLEASDTILFLTSLNVSALRSGAAGLAAFRHLGMDLQKVKIVVMREDTGEDVTLKHAREALGLPIYWKTPSDYQAVVSAINSGHPVVTASPRSKIAKNLRQLAEMLPGGPGKPGEPSAKPSTSLLRLVWTPKGLPGGAS